MAKPVRLAKSERTRNAILAAARTFFSERGFERTTVRDIAAEALIDPAMVIRYFGSKEALFAESAVLELDLPNLRDTEPQDIGVTLVAHFLSLWEGEHANGGFPVLLRSAMSNESAAERLRSIFSRQVAPAIAPLGSAATASRRAGLVASQLLGLALCRYILRLEPVATLSSRLVIRHVGSTIQRYATGK